MRVKNVFTTVAAAVGTAALLAGCASGAADPATTGDAGGDSSGTISTGGLGLIQDGQWRVCATLEIPPNDFLDEDGNEVGFEVEIAEAMAEKLGLELRWEVFKFTGLMPALQANQCDTIMSALYIRPEREEIVDFVPYLRSGSGVAVSEANPAGVTGFDDTLCGTTSLAVNGATGAVLLEEKTDECVEKGLEPIEIAYVDKSSDALQQVIAGQVDAFVNTAEVMKYYEQQSDGAFQAVGDPVAPVEIGAATLKGNDALHDALSQAFDEVVADGTYHEILERWDVMFLDITVDAPAE